MDWKIFGQALLALVIWREARGEGYKGMLAVAHSIMNRVKRPSWWGKDLAEVIGKKWQYSSLTDPHDPQTIRFPKSSTDERFDVAIEVVRDVIGYQSPNPVPGADSYYDISIKAPKWATPNTFVAQVGRLRFHNLDRDIEKESL